MKNILYTRAFRSKNAKAMHIVVNKKNITSVELSAIRKEALKAFANDIGVTIENAPSLIETINGKKTIGLITTPHK